MLRIVFESPSVGSPSYRNSVLRNRGSGRGLTRGYAPPLVVYIRLYQPSPWTSYRDSPRTIIVPFMTDFKEGFECRQGRRNAMSLQNDLVFPEQDQSVRSLGLAIIRQLRPIRFNWKEDGRPDIGLGAEDVAKVAPSLAFSNSE